MQPRVAASVLVGALIRRAEDEGGFGAVLERGDSTAGSILVILLEKGRNPRLYERLLKPDGAYSWQESRGHGPEGGREVPALIARRKRFDPDLWVLELDIPSIERFAAEMNQLD
jgi:hypothetical protein